MEKCSCGNEADLTFSSDDTDGILHYQWFVSCYECHKHTTGHKTQEEAIEAWNKKEIE